MILKVTDSKNTTDKLVQAGYAAEKQMAFYLKRAFEGDDKILILSDLRLVDNDNVAQIDHLIIHECGFIIVESKSVSTKVSVNKHAEWKRHFNQREKGMPSPVQQAKRQAQFLNTYLNKYGLDLFKESFITKLIKKTYENLFFDVLIAISDDGIIERNNIELPEVHKADTIPDKIVDIIAKRKKNVLTEIIPKHVMVHPDTQKKIALFLTEKHSPTHINTTNKKKQDALSNNDSVKENALKYGKERSLLQCKKCHSQNLEVTYGKYGYYFKCLDCSGNTAIKLTCKQPTCKPKIKKEKTIFYKVCNDCDIKEIFFTNQ